MIWGYPYFWKHPSTKLFWQCEVQKVNPFIGQVANSLESTIVWTNLLDSPYDFASCRFIVEVSVLTWSPKTLRHSNIAMWGGYPKGQSGYSSKNFKFSIAPPTPSEKVSTLLFISKCQIPLAFNERFHHTVLIGHHFQNGSKIRHLPVILRSQTTWIWNLKLFRAATGFDLVFFTGL